jgi:hypothetical protein
MRQTLLLTGILWVLFAASVQSAPPAQATGAWRGEYFANRNLQGAPSFTRDDANIDFVWGANSPGAGIPADDFSVRWTRWYLIDVPGNWTFTTITDDGVRLFVDDQIVIDAWSDQTLTARSATLNLSPSFHLVRMEYYERGANAQAQLFITSANFPDWRGEYYSNVNFAGAPAFTRNDRTLHFNFGTAGPGGGVPGENFSARWTRSQFFNAGRYRFTTTTDDGVRLFIDGQLLIDQWKDQTSKSWSAEISLTEGDHWIRMDYFQRGANALATLIWTPVTGSTELWRGEFFANSNLEGTPAFARDDAALDFAWGNDAPGRGIRAAEWSARWTSKRNTTTPGFYTVTATSDDGVRVWVDGNLLIDEWHDQSPTTYAAMPFLTAGAHDWRIEYYQRGGTASLQMAITPGALAPEQSKVGLPAREIVIDTKNARFIQSAGWQSAGGQSQSIKNVSFAQTDFKWVRWHPLLAHAGEYAIFVYLPANIGTTHSARYVVAHAGGFDTRIVNQSLYADQWVGLGKFYFSATGNEFVTLSDVTFEPTQSTVIVADAIKWVSQ